MHDKSNRNKALILLQDGTIFFGKALGVNGTACGELCFNTGMTGYQEIFTDPSYYGQLMVTTNSHIGNYGVNDKEVESESPKIAGLICKNFNSKFSMLLGLRAEMIAIEIDYLTLQSSNEERIAFIKEKLLPSLSAKYVLKENMNLKFGASKTYTLPQFKERVNMLYEEVTQVYRGNNYVYESTNWNADLKWEYFPNEGELISATLFGKLIQNPINSIFINSTSNDISYINTGKQAEVFGLELEIKKNLFNFNAEDDEYSHKITGGLNLSMIQTSQDLDAQKVTNETDYSANFTFDSSKLTGASDFLMNADVSYLKEFDEDKSIQATIAYNYFSDQLNTIGTLNKGNVIDKSYSTLDFVLKSKLKQFTFGVSAKNILDPTISRIQEVYDTPGINSVVLDEFKRGVNLSLSVGYKF